MKPSKPYPAFPLGAWPNGQWAKKIGGVPYYFGTWADDPKGERALAEYNVRITGIAGGTDHLRHLAAGVGQLTVGDLLRDYTAQRQLDVTAGTLSPTTFGGYLTDLTDFSDWIKPTTAVTALLPEHFTGYANHLIGRGLKARARKRTQAYVKAMFRWGPSKGYPVPVFGTGFKAPTTTQAAMRQEKQRDGRIDYSDRILSGTEIDSLLAKSGPNMQAMILLGINCGLGPADLGRLRWRHLDMENGKLDYPRHKTGNLRMGFLWKRTREALNALLHPAHGHPLKYTKQAFDREGQNALVFVTRRNEAYWRTSEVIEDGRAVGVQVHNAISITFGRLAKGMGGVSFYRLRHTFNTMAKRAKDQDALDVAMGHVNASTGATYNHDDVEFKRLRRLAIVVKKRLWPKPKRSAGMTGIDPMRIGGDGRVEAA